MYFNVSSWEFGLESLNLLFLLEALPCREDAAFQFFNTFNLIDLKYSDGARFPADKIDGFIFFPATTMTLQCKCSRLTGYLRLRYIVVSFLKY